MQTKTASQLQADATHQREGIACMNYSRAHFVVELDFTVHKLINEVDVGSSALEGIDYLRQFQIMGRDHAHAAAISQLASESFGPLDTVTRICPLEVLPGTWTTGLAAQESLQRASRV